MGTRKGWDDKCMAKPMPTPRRQQPSPDRASPNHGDSWVRHPARPALGLQRTLESAIQGFIFTQVGEFILPRDCYSLHRVGRVWHWGLHQVGRAWYNCSWGCYFGDSEGGHWLQSSELSSLSLFFGEHQRRQQLEGPLGPLLELGPSILSSCPLHKPWFGLSCVGQFLFSGLFCFLLLNAFLSTFITGCLYWDLQVYPWGRAF